MKYGDVTILIGTGIILAGFGFIYWPLAVIATGIWLVAATLYATMKRGG